MQVFQLEANLLGFGFREDLLGRVAYGDRLAKGQQLAQFLGACGSTGVAFIQWQQAFAEVQL
ncbi:hypothetical protein D9M68_911260 [compost metagenome]